MRRSTQKLAPFFVVLVAALLAFPSLFSLHRNPVSAAVQIGQNPKTAKYDVAPKAKQPKAKTKIKAVNVAAPANDNCANAIAVVDCPFTDTKDTSGATDEVGEPQSTCTLQANSVWYSYTNANTSIVTVATCNSDYDTAIMVWKVNGAACDFANFSAVACNDDFCGDGLQSTASFTADPGASYKIQIGGFDGETGSLTTNIDCTVLNCDPVVINGTLGSGDPNFTGTQSSGSQTGRLNRNGISSTCAAPKTCLIFDPANLRAYDAYQIRNDSGQDACVSISLHEDSKETCNLQSNAYLDTYDPANICTGYLGDPGLSTGSPPTDTNFSVVVPADHTLIVVVHTTNPGETGCAYTVTILGDLCAGFTDCVQNDRNPAQFILFNRDNGKYEYHDCSKGTVLAGTGVVTFAVPGEFCKIRLTDSGPVPKRPDRSVVVDFNQCTHVGNASIKFPLTVKNPLTFTDSNTTNNNCVCP